MSDTKTTELQTQLDLQNQITQVLQSRMAIFKAQEKALTTQVQLAVDMCKALKCEQLDDISGRLENTRKELEKAAAAATDMGSDITKAAEEGSAGAGQLGDAFREASEEIDAADGAVAGLVVGLVRGLGSAYQTVTNLATGFGGLISTVFNLGTAIVGLPFKLFENLLGLAQGSASGSPSPVRLELENIRKEFGDLSTATGKVAASSLGQFRKEAQNLGGTGLSLRKIYGSGPEGLAKAMAENLELMKALGPAVDNFSDVLSSSAGPLAAFRKGLGLSVEQQADLMKTAKSAGKDPVKAMTSFASQALNMSDKFGISAKLIAKDMAEMNADVANFGTLGPQVFSQISVYARKLGIEVKSLTGLISAFDDFESAAQSAAKLSQAFGMNVDAMKMMQEQDPAARLSMLQKALKETGKSFEQMNRSEQKLLISQSGLDEQAAKAAFSQNGLSKSYDQVQKEGAKAAKKQLTQEQVMQKLAKSIDRVIESMNQTDFTGFFDAFTKGFTSGIMKSREFKQAMRAINAALKAIWRGGVDVGKMFVKMFPGIKDMLGGIKDLFNPGRFRKLMTDVKKLFEEFFKDLRTDPKAGVEKFLDKFKDLFKKFFAASGPGTNTLLEGGKMFMKALGAIFKALLPIVLDGLVSAIKMITEVLKEPPGVPSAVTELMSSLGEALREALLLIWEKLAPAFEEMLMTLFEKVKPFLLKAGAAVLGIVVGQMVLNAVITGLSGAVAAAAAKKVAEFFGKIFSPGGGGGGPGPGPDPGQQAGASIAESMKNFIKGFKEIIAELAGMNPGQILMAGVNMALIALSFMPTLFIFAGAVVLIAKMFTLELAATALLAMLAIAAAAGAVYIASKAFENITPGMIGKAVVGALAAALILVVGVFAFVLAIRMMSSLFKGVDWVTVAIGFVAIAVIALALMGLIFVASLIGATKELALAAVLGLGLALLFLVAMFPFVALLMVLQPLISKADINPILWLGLAVVFLVIVGVMALSAMMIGAAPTGTVGLNFSLPFLASLAVVFLALIGIDFLLKKYGLGLDNVTIAFLQLAVIFVSLIAIATAAILVGAMSIAAAFFLEPIGLFLLGIFAAIGIFYLMSKVIETIEFVKLEIGFLKLTAIFLTLIILAGAAVAGGIMAAAGLIPLAAISLFLLGINYIILPTLESLRDNLPQIVNGDLTENLVKLSKIFESIVSIAANAIAGGVLGVLGTIALLGIVAFLKAATFLLDPSLRNFARLMNDIVSETSVQQIEAFQKLLASIALLASVTSIASNISESKIRSTMTAIQTLGTEIEGKIGPFVRTISGLGVDVSKLGSQLESLTKIFEFVKSFTAAVSSIAKTSMDADADNAPLVLRRARELADGVMNGVKGIIDKISSLNMSDSQINAARALGESMQSMGQLVKAMLPSPDLIKSLTDDSLIQDHTDERIRSVGTYMGSVFEAIKNNIGDIFNSVKTVAQGIEDPAKLESQVKVIGAALSVLGTMAQIIANVTKTAKDITGGKDVEKNLDALIHVIKKLNWSLFGAGNNAVIKTTLDGIADLAKGINVTDMDPQIKTLASMFEIIAKFATTIGDVAKLMPDKQKTEGDVGESPEAFAKRIEKLVGPDGLIPAVVGALTGENGIDKVFNSISSMFAMFQLNALLGGKGFEKQVSLFINMFDVISKFASALSDISGLVKTDKGIDSSKIAGFLGAVNAALFNINGSGGGAMNWIVDGLVKLVKDTGGKLVGKEKQIAALGKTFKALGEFSEAMNELKELDVDGAATGQIQKTMGNLSKSIGDPQFNTTFVALIGGLNTISATASGFVGNTRSLSRITSFADKLVDTINSLTSVATNISEISVGKVTELNTALADIKSSLTLFEDDQDAKLIVDIAKNLRGNGRVTFKHENVNINLAVEVNMSAEQIGKGVIKWNDKSVGAPDAGQPDARRFATTYRNVSSVPSDLRS